MLTNESYTRRLQVLLLSLSAASLTLVLHSIGFSAFLYWSLWWFDILTHALGGFAIGLLIIFLIPNRYLFSLALLISIISWEVFEVVCVGAVFSGVDSVTDVLIGIAAALIAARLYRRMVTTSCAP